MKHEICPINWIATGNPECNCETPVSGKGEGVSEARVKNIPRLLERLNEMRQYAEDEEEYEALDTAITALEQQAGRDSDVINKFRVAVQDSLPADPDDEDAVCLKYEYLELILKRALGQDV